MTTIGIDGDVLFADQCCTYSRVQAQVSKLMVSKKGDLALAMSGYYPEDFPLFVEELFEKMRALLHPTLFARVEQPLPTGCFPTIEMSCLIISKTRNMVVDMKRQAWSKTAPNPNSPNLVLGSGRPHYSAIKLRHPNLDWRHCVEFAANSDPYTGKDFVWVQRDQLTDFEHYDKSLITSILSTPLEG